MFIRQTVSDDCLCGGYFERRVRSNCFSCGIRGKNHEKRDPEVL